MSPAENLGSALLRATWIESSHDLSTGRRPDDRRPRHEVDHPIPIGSIGPERLPPAIKMMPPTVAHSANVNLQPELFGAELPDPAAVHPANTVGSLNVAVDVDGLIEIQIPAGTVAEGVENMVGILDPEA